MIPPFKTRVPVGQNGHVFSWTDASYHTPHLHMFSAKVYHRLTSWRWCCLSDCGTEWSSGSSAGNCCHLNGVAGRGYQQCCSVGSLTLASPRHRNTHCTAITSAIAYSVSRNVTVAINAWYTPPSNENANRAGSHYSDICGWIIRGCMGGWRRAVNRNLQFWSRASQHAEMSMSRINWTGVK